MLMKKALIAAPMMAFLMCGTAHAALTADQVWADLQTALTTGGVKIAAATQVQGDGELTLNGVTVGPEGGPAMVTISELSLVEQEDGSVAFFPGDIKIEPIGPATIAITHQELSFSVFDDAGGLGYGIDADSLKVEVDTAEGTGDTAKSFDGTFDLTSFGGRYTREADAMGVELSAENVAYDIKQKDAALGLDSAQISTAADMVLSGQLTIPEGVDLMAIESAPAFLEAARAGLGLSVELTQGVSTGEVIDNNPMLPMSLAFAAQPSTTSFSADADAIDISTSVEGLDITARPPMVPAPMNAKVDSLGMGFAMPVIATEAPGEYSVSMNLGNLVLEDGIWAMIDPTSVLDRSPLDLALDLGGTAKIDLIELAMAEETGQPPKSMPELLSLDITTLAVKALGAAATGTGAFTFDNSMVAAGGPPMPIGTADVRLEGGNKVIDALIKLGVMTEEDATGARMMMAMFGKPDGDDVLTSKIEAKEGGSIFVNGQQIQ